MCVCVCERERERESKHNIIYNIVVRILESDWSVRGPLFYL